MRIGNRQGWALAAVLAVVYGGLLMALESAGSATPPTPLARSSDAMGELALPAGAADLLAAPEDRDASDLIRRLVRAASGNARDYQRFSTDDIPTLPALDLLLAQAPMARVDHRAADFAYSVGYHPPAHIEGDAFETLSSATQRAALLYQVAKRLPESRALFEAEYALGLKLFKARLSYADVRNAILLLSDGVAGLERLAKVDADAPSLARLLDLEAGLKELGERTRSVWIVVGAVDPGIIGQHAGDIAPIARDSKERVWRLEATLKLGRMRYSVGNGGTGVDQRNARRTLHSLLRDPDPAVAHAAQLASDLSVEDYRALR